jgi:zinc protease
MMDGRRARFLAWLARAAAIAVAALATLPAAAGGAVQEWRVDEGTTGLLVEDRRAPVVSLRLEFAAGTWSPWVRENDAGTAFERQLQDSKGELRRRADRLAADLALSSGERSSSLDLTCNKEDLPAALELVRDVLSGRDLDRKEIARLRQAKKIDWQSALKNPRFVLQQAGARLLFREDDPRRRPYEKPKPPGSDLDDLLAARDALVRLPGRVVGFAGDLSLDEARQLAQGLLPSAGGAPAGAQPALGPIAPADRRPRNLTVWLPRLTQVYFMYGRESLGWRDPDYAASRIADHALGGHFYSRLMVALRHESGDTYGAGVLDLGELDPGAYAIRTFTRTDNAEATEGRIREVLAKFHAEGITEEERALAAGNALGRRAFAKQSPGQILFTVMRERRHGLPYGFFDRQAEEAASLPLEEVNAFIRRFYDPARFTMLTLRPE